MGRARRLSLVRHTDAAGRTFRYEYDPRGYLSAEYLEGEPAESGALLRR